MERLSASWDYCSLSGSSGTTTRRTRTKDMIEQALEELQILEAQHPNKFNYLKLELKAFISHLEVSCLNSTCISISSSVATQESSAGKKRKKGDLKNQQVMDGSKNVEEAPKQKLQGTFSFSSGSGCSKRRKRIDEVVERAQACLHKLQQLKTSFS